MPTTITKINCLIEASWDKIEKSIDKKWIKEHLVLPRKIELCIDIENKKYDTFWLVTDHIGKNDSSYRVVYDEVSGMFGLETILDDGTNWYLGNYGDFSDAINSM